MKKLLLLGSLSLWSLSAATLFSNGTPNGTGGANFNDLRVAEDFTLATGATLDTIRFWTFSQSTDPTNSATATIDNVSWIIYANASGAPGAVLQSGSVANLLGFPDGSFQGQRNITVNFALAAGTYYLELHTASAASVAGPTSFFWSNTGTNQGQRYLTSSDLNTIPATQIADFDKDQTHLAFQLLGTADSGGGSAVPEPSTYLLSGLGLAALAWYKRR